MRRRDQRRVPGRHESIAGTRANSPVEIPEVEVTVHWHDTFDKDEGSRWFRELIIETLRED